MRNRYSSNSRSSSGRPTSTKDARTTPGTLAKPPTMITTRTVMDTITLKLWGNTEPILVANSAPPNPASMAPAMNADSFAVTMSTPMASATASSSRIAIHARPIREPCSA